MFSNDSSTLKLEQGTRERDIERKTMVSRRESNKNSQKNKNKKIVTLDRAREVGCLRCLRNKLSCEREIEKENIGGVSAKEWLELEKRDGKISKR